MTDEMKKTVNLKRRQQRKPAEAGTVKLHQRPMTKERVYTGVSIKSDLWRRLRALALTECRLTGDLLDEAIENYLQKKVAEK